MINVCFGIVFLFGILSLLSFYVKHYLKLSNDTELKIKINSLLMRVGVFCEIIAGIFFIVMFSFFKIEKKHFEHRFNNETREFTKSVPNIVSNYVKDSSLSEVAENKLSESENLTKSNNEKDNEQEALVVQEDVVKKDEILSTESKNESENNQKPETALKISDKENSW